MVDIEILQIVVEINGTGTQVPTEKRCMCCEYGSHVDMSLTTKGYGDTCLPFMKVGDDSCCQLTGDVLSVESIRKVRCNEAKGKIDITEKPRYEIAKNDGLVRFMVIWRTWNSRQIP